MASSERTVAFLGAGSTMGLAMARNLARAGFEICAWNRTPEKALPLKDDGATVALTPADAAANGALIVTMLRDAEAVIETMEGEEGALAGAQPGAVWIQMSTIGIEGTERCAQLADQAGLVFVDAPVSGTKQPAEKGELVVLASGPEEARPRCQPVFDVVGAQTHWLGAAGSGTRMKLVVNGWLTALVEGLAETIGFAEGIGVDPAQFLEVIRGGPVDTGYAQLKGKAMIERNFEPSFKLELAAKDARLLTEAAQRHSLELPLFELVRDRLAAAAEEHGDEDLSAAFLATAARQPTAG
ncbi:MAG: 3-hydroxyisobutyrate dehydrogenase [Solirubrobacterales bacterium]|jgi:3-hydroxyisobutyrate dehydrogenase|nr:3-hydroxyisobutyrate dehydrogenase [Solirubrobacterales bacterium]